MVESFSPPALPVNKGSPIKAIAIGALVDIIGSMIIGSIYVIHYGILLSIRGLSIEKILNTIENIDPHSTFSIIGSSIGCLVSLLAGYLCARIVNYSEYKFASILGLISVIFGLAIGGSYYPTAGNLILVVLTFASVILGAYLHVKSKVET